MEFQKEEQQELYSARESIQKRTSLVRRSSQINRRENSILYWRDLGMEVTVREKKGLFKYEEKQVKIVENMNGYAKSGECLAIIGGSGAGKSSFMNLLSDRVKINKETKITGKVEINGHKMSYEKYKHVIGFVMQADIFLEHLTVNEYFQFAIDLRGAGLSEKEKEVRLENTIQITKLETAKNNYVGGIYRKGISGGEKKRLNIGFELLGDPTLVFLDEPTSGLDSYTSFLIISLLRQIAIDNNIVMIYTIHQPSIETFTLFDNLLILDRGRNIYFGEARKTIDYYQQMDYPVPPNTNPPNHFIALALRGPEKNEEFYNEYNIRILPSIITEIEANKHLTLFRVENRLVGPLSQYKILLVRAFKNFVRNPMSFWIRVAQICFLIIIFNMLFFRMSTDFTNPINVINREGAFFFLSINLFISYFNNYLLTCKLKSPRRKGVLFKRVQLWFIWCFALYSFQIDDRIAIHKSFCRVFCWCYLLHCGIQFRSKSLFFGKLILKVGGSMVITCTSSMFGFMLGTIITSKSLALEIAPLFFLPALLFSGFTTNLSLLNRSLDELDEVD